MKIAFTDTAVKQLEDISRGNKRDAQRIVEKIEAYANNPQGNFNIKILKGKFGDRLRLRIGDYRVVFKIENEIMQISIIKHRKDVYHD